MEISVKFTTHAYSDTKKSLRYRFTMLHCPGKWHRAPDAISRNPVTTVQSLLDTFPIEPSPIDTDESDEICAVTRLTALTSISQLDGYPAITSLDHIRFAGQKDTQYTLLGKTIDNGFPNSRQATPPTIREYWEVRNRLSNDNGLILDSNTNLPAQKHMKVPKFDSPRSSWHENTCQWVSLLAWNKCFNSQLQK